MFGSFPYTYLFPYSVCRVRPEDHPIIAAPVVAIAIERSSQLADSLVDSPIRIEFSVNQVCFSCQLFMHCIVRTVHGCCVVDVRTMCAVYVSIGMDGVFHTDSSCTVYYCVLSEEN